MYVGRRCGGRAALFGAPLPQHPAARWLPTWSGLTLWALAGGELLASAGGEPVRLRMRNSSCSREQRSASSRDSRPSRT